MANTGGGEGTVEQWCRYHHGHGKVVVTWRVDSVCFSCAVCGSTLQLSGTMAHPTTADEAVEILARAFGEMATYYALQAWPALWD